MNRKVVVLLLIGALVSVAFPFAALAQHAEHYVLDGYGGVHAGDGAPIINPATLYFGWDAAIDIEYIPVGTATATGDGILVLDRWGGVHKGGALAADPPSPSTPYFGFDIARAIVYRDIPPRLAWDHHLGAVTATDFSYVTLASVDIYAPDDGYLLVNGVALVECATDIANDLVAEFLLALDGAQPTSVTWAAIPDCYYGGGLTADNRSATASYVFPVGAGNHVVDLVGRKTGANSIYFTHRTLTVLFLDKDKSGQS